MPVTESADPSLALRVTWAGRLYGADLTQPVSITLPLGGHAPRVRAWDAPPTEITPVRRGDWIGEVGAGSPVNFATLTLTPHGAGTHTESYAHISELTDANAVARVAPLGFVLTELVDLDVVHTEEGRQLDLSRLRQNPPSTPAVILRSTTHVLGDRNLSGSDPPYLRAEDAGWLADCGVEHLLTDLPSLDREADGGALAAHRAFWKYPDQIRTYATVTELVDLNQDLTPGLYLLSLNVLPVRADASPSLPILYALTPLDS